MSHVGGYNSLFLFKVTRKLGVTIMNRVRVASEAQDCSCGCATQRLVRRYSVASVIALQGPVRRLNKSVVGWALLESLGSSG